MESRDAINKFIQVSSIMSRSDLSLLHPRDFEFYMMALELADSEDNLIDYFAFPVMPESISKVENQIVNSKKTMSGITVLTTQSNSIQSISIKGDFGRSFKLVLNPRQPSVSGYAFSIDSGKYDQFKMNANSVSMTFPSFLQDIKTGFGAMNTLRSIIGKATCTDKSGNPLRLYLYNMALGEAYLVTLKPEGMTISQNLQKNMIWCYSLTLDILAPLELVRGGNRLSSSVAAVSVAAIQKDLNSKLKSLRSVL